MIRDFKKNIVKEGDVRYVCMSRTHAYESITHNT